MPIDVAGKTYLYSDGSSKLGDSSDDLHQFTGTSSKLIVGRGAAHPATSERWYTGAIGELQILNVELTAAEVLEDAKKVMPWL